MRSWWWSDLGSDLRFKFEKRILKSDSGDERSYESQAFRCWIGMDGTLFQSGKGELATEPSAAQSDEENVLSSDL